MKTVGCWQRIDASISQTWEDLFRRFFGIHHNNFVKLMTHPLVIAPRETVLSKEQFAKSKKARLVIQCGLSDEWRSDAVARHSQLRNIHDSLADEKQTHATRYGEPFD